MLAANFGNGVTQRQARRACAAHGVSAVKPAGENGNEDMIQALLVADQERMERSSDVADLVAFLEANQQIAVEVTSCADRLRHLDDFDVVIGWLTRDPLGEQHEQDLVSFVARGGGLVCLGRTGEAWSEHARIRDMLGLDAGERSPVTELVAHVEQNSSITRRLDPSVTVCDSCYLVGTTPADTEVALHVTWRFTSIPVAYARRWGSGSVFNMSLGDAPQSLAHPTLRQLVFRATRYVSGWRERDTISIAMIGYGAIGFEHGSAIRDTSGLDYTLVCDRSPARLDAARQAFPALRTTTAIEEVEANDAIDLVIVCTPPNTHAAVAERMLRAGKHVVVEKPFCITTAEADTLIGLAEQRQRVMTVYQNRRWDPDFLAIRQVIAEGAIGDVFHVETFIGGFAHPCDFWHSHEPISGGVFYDWGSHYLDWVLTLLPGPVRDVRASAHKRVWHDVTNADQARLSIRFADGREAEFLHSDVAAFLKPKWYVLGTRGALIADWRYESVTSRKWSGDLIEERLAPAEALPIVRVASRGLDGRIHEQRLALPPAPVNPFHRNLADHLLAGEPLAVQPASSRRNIAVMEAAAYSAAHEAEVVPIAAEYA